MGSTGSSVAIAVEKVIGQRKESMQTSIEEDVRLVRAILDFISTK
jgi:hypothetical protein